MQKVVMSASKVAFHCLTRSREVNGLLACLLKGTYNQTMDAKGRMTFPTKLRELIGERFIVTKGIDGCLFVYSLEDFEKEPKRSEVCLWLRRELYSEALWRGVRGRA